MSYKDILTLITQHGASCASFVNKQVTHLVTTKDAFMNNTNAVRQAKKYNIEIVSENFIQDSIANGTLAEVKDYKIGTKSAN